MPSFDEVNESGEDLPYPWAKDIAWQLVNRSPGNKAKVVDKVARIYFLAIWKNTDLTCEQVLMGGGYPAFFPESMKDDLEDQGRAS